MPCPFCEIAARRIPANIVYQDERATAFRDIHPRAPTHILIIPNQHVESLATLDNPCLAGHLLDVARKVADELSLPGGYRVVTNVGPDGGQTVFHMHLHLMAGRSMTWPPG